VVAAKHLRRNQDRDGLQGSSLGQQRTGCVHFGRQEARRAWKLVSAALNRHVQDLFEMAGIASLFQIYGSKEDALQQLAS